MLNVVEFVTSTSKCPPGNGPGEIKPMFWPLPVHRRSLPSIDLSVAIEEAAVSIGALNPDVHVKCCTASTSDPDAWNLSVTVRFGVVTVPVKLGFARGA
jgi:hypothetical protein